MAMHVRRHLLLAFLATLFIFPVGVIGAAETDTVTNTVSLRDNETMVRSLATAVFSGDASRVKIPASITSDTMPHQIFISISNGRGPARVLISSGYGMAQAIRAGMAQAIAQRTAHFQPIWLRLDIPTSAMQINIDDPAAPLLVRRGFDGIAIGAPYNVSFLPDEIVAAGLLTHKSILDRDRLMMAIKIRNPECPANAPFPSTLFAFNTESYFTDGKTVVPLYRGHRLPTKITKVDLLKAASQAGAYLTRSVKDDGRFVYIYDPITNTEPQEYNILRHTGAVYAMLDLYSTTKDRALLAAAKRGIGYLLTTVQPAPGNVPDARCVVEDNSVKLGGNALAVLALAKYTTVTHDKQYLPIMRQLGRWMELQLLPNGFFVPEIDYPSGKQQIYDADYYPGEAIFALTRLYAVDKQAHWLDCAEKATRYIITERDNVKDDEELRHDHWLLYGLNELYRLRPDPSYPKHALRIARVMIASQTLEYPSRDWIGSFEGRPESTPTATRTEGLCATYQLLHDLKYPKSDVDGIRATIERALCFQLSMQYHPESVLYFDDPARALGGFRAGLFDTDIRNDYVQHNLCGILSWYRMMK